MRPSQSISGLRGKIVKNEDIDPYHPFRREKEMKNHPKNHP
jgi:hypothetical protein